MSDFPACSMTLAKSQAQSVNGKGSTLDEGRAANALSVLPFLLYKNRTRLNQEQ
ncbi:hypothetical protein [Psychromonas sp.]|uniref:hypothetical protein n=1 Tax=Psychromonas sp. TaxID=1884585 RepID=UPI0039E6C635